MMFNKHMVLCPTESNASNSMLLPGSALPPNVIDSKRNVPTYVGKAEHFGKDKKSNLSKDDISEEIALKVSSMLADPNMLKKLQGTTNTSAPVQLQANSTSEATSSVVSLGKDDSFISALCNLDVNDLAETTVNHTERSCNDPTVT